MHHAQKLNSGMDCKCCCEQPIIKQKFFTAISLDAHNNNIRFSSQNSASAYYAFSDILSEVKEDSQLQATKRPNIKDEGRHLPETTPSTSGFESSEHDTKRGSEDNNNDISEKTSSCPLIRMDGSVAAVQEEVMAFQSNTTESDAGIQYRLQGTFTRYDCISHCP